MAPNPYGCLLIIYFQIRVANAFKQAGHERHRRLSLLAEASSHKSQSGHDGSHWWTAKKNDNSKLTGYKSAHQPLLEGVEDDTAV